MAKLVERDASPRPPAPDPLRAPDAAIAGARDGAPRHLAAEGRAAHGGPAGDHRSRDRGANVDARRIIRGADARAQVALLLQLQNLADVGDNASEHA